MKKLLSFVFLSLFFVQAHAAEKLNLCTGSPTGIYTEAGIAIKQFVDSSVIDLNIITTEGSWDNVGRLAVRNKDIANPDLTCDLAFSQPDGWVMLNRENNALAKNMISIMDFHREYAHLLCSKQSNFKDINSYEDAPSMGLKKHNIAVGAEGSGSWLVWSNWGESDSSYGPDNVESVYVGGELALVELEQGRVECMLVTGAVPFPLVSKAASQYTDSIDLVDAADWDLNDTVDERGKPLYSFDHAIDTSKYPEWNYWSNVKTISWNAKLYYNPTRVSKTAFSALIGAAKRAQKEIQGKYGK